jgi:hypothetical protein
LANGETLGKFSTVPELGELGDNLNYPRKNGWFYLYCFVFIESISDFVRYVMAEDMPIK